MGWSDPTSGGLATGSSLSWEQSLEFGSCTPWKRGGSREKEWSTKGTCGRCSRECIWEGFAGREKDGTSRVIEERS